MRFWSLMLALASLFTFIDGTDIKCTYPKRVGTGSLRLFRYYFRKDTGECERFLFKGRGGNGNNFNDIETCQKTCICNLPLKRGVGQAKLPRWYHDTQSRTCKPLEYFGSQGNANNFLTLEKCQQTCVDICKLAPDNKNTVHWYNCMSQYCLLRFSYIRENGECRPIYFYNKKEGNWNANSFATKNECMAKCGCKYQKDIKKVSQRGPYTIYYLDGNTQKCELGKGNGNFDNSFSEIDHCIGKCVCSQPPDSGFGNRYSQKFFFNPITKMCESFTFAGKGGNANRFDTKAICIRKCGCLQEKDVGKGLKALLRYHFDDIKGCLPFSYKGVGGNQNKFNTLQECTGACGACDADPEPYPKASRKHYYFDKKDQTCKAFDDGNYGKNANNFKTLHACLSGCGCRLPLKRSPTGKGEFGYYYHKNTRMCKRIMFKGKGNANKFKNNNACKAACGCGLPKHVGYGSSPVTRYFFDPITETCKSFSYKGRGGNGNNYWNLRNCNLNCRCNLPRDDGHYGPIEDKLYFYDKEKRDCFELQAGHEGGNANRFKTKADCQKACK